MTQQTQVYLDEWQPPKQQGHSGRFKVRDFAGNQTWFGCWEDKAAQAFPYVGSNQPVTVAYTSRTTNNGKTYYDITKFLDGAPQAPGPQHVSTVAPPAPMPAAPSPGPFPTGQPQTAAPTPPAQHTPQAGAAMMTFKDYSIAMQAFAKAFAGQLSLADPLETTRQLHELVCAHHDSYGFYQRGEGYNPKGAPTMGGGNSQAVTDAGGAPALPDDAVPF